MHGVMPGSYTGSGGRVQPPVGAKDSRRTRRDNPDRPGRDLVQHPLMTMHMETMAERRMPVDTKLGPLYPQEANQIYAPKYFRLNTSIGSQKKKKKNKRVKTRPLQLTELHRRNSGQQHGLCKQCKISVERDAEFWGRSWKMGGELMLSIVEEHSQLYPYFLQAFLTRMGAKIKTVLAENPSMVKSFVDTNQMVATFLKSHPELIPSLLREQLSTADVSKLAAQLHDRPDLIKHMLKSNPELLTGIVKEIGEIAPSDGPQNLGDLLPGLINNDKTGILVKDALSTVQDAVSPKMMEQVMTSPESYQALIDMILGNEKLLKMLLAQCPLEMISQILARLLKDHRAIETFTPQIVREVAVHPAFDQEGLLDMVLNNPELLERLLDRLPENAKPTTLSAEDIFMKCLELLDNNVHYQELIIRKIGTNMMLNSNDMKAALEEAADNARREAEGRIAEEKAKWEAEREDEKFTKRDALAGLDSDLGFMLSDADNADKAIEILLEQHSEKLFKAVDLVRPTHADLKKVKVPEVAEAQGEQFWDAVEEMAVKDPQLLQKFTKHCEKCGRGPDAPPEEEKEVESKKTKKSKKKEHKWSVWLDGKVKTKDAPIPHRKFMELIWEIYEAKIEQGAVDQSLADFCADFLLIKFGTKKLVKSKLRQMVKSIKAHVHEHPFITAFAQFIGYNLPSDIKPRDESHCSLYLWGIERILQERNSLKLTLIDNEGRNRIKAAGGKAILGTVILGEAQTVLDSLVASFDVDRQALYASLEEAAWTQKKEKTEYMPLETLLDLFLTSVDHHQETERERLVKLFEATDEDDSGAVDYQEFKKLVENLPAFEHLSEFECTRLFNRGTQDGDELDVQSFISLAEGEMKSALSKQLLANIEQNMLGGEKSASYNQMMADHVLEVFNTMDTEGKGEIDTKQFPELMKGIGFEMSPNEATAVVRIIDKDGDGNVDFSEFLAWWREYAMEHEFLKFDVDGSGELSVEEVQQLMKHLGVRWESEEEMQEIFMDLDEDGSGEVSFAELLEWFAVFDASSVFKKYDTDQSGALGADELNKVLQDLGMHVSPGDLQGAIQMLDKDGNGELSFDEFMPWWTSQQRMQKRAKMVAQQGGRGTGSDDASEGPPKRQRRQSQQVELSTQNNSYLKMKAQRERILEEGKTHLKAILTAIAEDNNLDKKVVFKKYLVSQEASSGGRSLIKV